MQKTKNPILTRTMIPLYAFILVGIALILLWELFGFSNPVIMIAYAVAGVAVAASTRSRLDREKRRQHQDSVTN